MGERLSLTWASGVGDVELVDGLAVGTQARLTAAVSVSSTTKRASLGVLTGSYQGLRPGEGAHHRDLGGN